MSLETQYSQRIVKVELWYLIEIIQNVQICYVKFHAINDDFQAILKLSHNSNTLILDKVWLIAIATNCLFSFTN